MATLSLQARATVPSGTTTIPPFQPPIGTRIVVVQVSLADILSLTLDFSLAVELSRDAGVTWMAAGGCGLSLPRANGQLTAGGLRVPKEGGGDVVAASTDLNISLAIPTDAQSRVRARVVSNEAFTAAITGVVL